MKNLFLFSVMALAGAGLGHAVMLVAFWLLPPTVATFFGFFLIGAIGYFIVSIWWRGRVQRFADDQLREAFMRGARQAQADVDQHGREEAMRRAAARARDILNRRNAQS